ncbi:Type 1 glutamine amidotransferase-like domain-containing protein [Planococcus lenghuensis]|uniref:Peptidase E n=1 Tax=Planococcus lenghuensis TaxID=2213202 RepID=A0A1Q2L082_9BACL|nr:Type 1 glutamine amidotransferase-like domain-containing protein [Planococcus lenghuensis]AQQ53302.1 hypothetical protein B0X71_09570 [Planococcus lenghuensis]
MKKIMLTSTGLSTDRAQEAFLSMVDAPITDNRVCIIPTATVHLKEQHPRIRQAIGQFRALGFGSIDCVDIEHRNPDALSGYDVFYIGGGNPFHLLQAFRRSGADIALHTLANTGAILIGVSAGALVLGPDLAVAEVFTPEMRLSDQNTGAALGIVPFPFMPHADREDLFPGDTPISDRLQSLKRRRSVRVEGIRDSEFILLDKGKIGKFRG